MYISLEHYIIFINIINFNLKKNINVKIFENLNYSLIDFPINSNLFNDYFICNINFLFEKKKKYYLISFKKKEIFLTFSLLYEKIILIEDLYNIETRIYFNKICYTKNNVFSLLLLLLKNNYDKFNEEFNDELIILKIEEYKNNLLLLPNKNLILYPILYNIDDLSIIKFN